VKNKNKKQKQNNVKTPDLVSLSLALLGKNSRTSFFFAEAQLTTLSLFPYWTLLIQCSLKHFENTKINIYTN
jgi:hypothetical protein